MTRIRAAAASLAAFIALHAAPAQAASEAEIDALFEAIGTPRLLEIMQSEGMDQARDLAEDMFDRRSEGFVSIAGRIYDPGRMAETFRDEFDAVLAETDVTPLLEFFGSDRGRRIVSLELSAREALLDEEVERAAEAAADAMVTADPERRDLIETFIATNDLIELNVMGAMNASVAYYQGLAAGGDTGITESQILSDVWSQEPEIREDTTTWIHAYLGMAYEPLEDADLEAYTAMSASPAGRALNRALFEGFDDVFNEISFLLGRATVSYGQSEEL